MKYANLQYGGHAILHFLLFDIKSFPVCLFEVHKVIAPRHTLCQARGSILLRALGVHIRFRNNLRVWVNLN